MRVDHEKAILGVRPATLKALFKRERFNTPTAMRILAMPEPLVSDILSRLSDDEWIIFEETTDYIDWWVTGPEGIRLSATRLGKRFSLSEGLSIVDRVVAEARAINSDLSYSWCIVSIILFGSVLTADRSADVGDVDLVVDVHRRKNKPELMAEIEAEERASAVGQRSFIARLTWPERRIQRRLRQISNKVSLHGSSDLEATGARHRQIYAFDPERGQEVPFDPTERILATTASTSPSTERTVPVRSRACVEPVEWPQAQANLADIHYDKERMELAEHMWINGASLDFIAAATNHPADVVIAYLSARPLVSGAAKPVIKSSLAATVASRLRQSRGYDVRVSAEVRPNRKTVLDVSLHHSNTRHPVAAIRQIDGKWRVNGAPSELLASLELAFIAASAWTDRLVARSSGVGVSARCLIGADADLDSFVTDPTDVPDFRPLANPLSRTLEPIASRARLLEPARNREYRLELTLGTNPPAIVLRWQENGIAKWRFVRGAVALPLVTASLAFGNQLTSRLEPCDEYIAFVVAPTHGF
jgi:hypothetical protein